MTYALRARHKVWADLMATVAATVGTKTDIYRAAIRARLGRDPGGARFAAIAARLPDRDRRRLLGKIE